MKAAAVEVYGGCRSGETAARSPAVERRAGRGGLSRAYGQTRIRQ